jgi:DNA-binding transcriptional regulator YhcF (GntR family)
MASIETFSPHAYVYEQVADTIEARIQSGQITGMLPAERELAHELGVAYQTIRRAISLLRARGLLVTRNGRGSFVTPQAELKTGQAIPEAAQPLGRLLITHRDAPSYYLITAVREVDRADSPVTASHVLAAIARTPTGPHAIAAAMPDVFPWTSHLSIGECSEFAADFISALSDAAELAIDSTVSELIVRWRAAAQAKADPGLRTQVPFGTSSTAIED